MTFLPIAEREQRVASRKTVTYRFRVGAALFALVVAGSIVLMAEGFDAFSGAEYGATLFSALCWVTFFGCCLAGVFLTADSLSEEKREGTLGLLFLTNLRGYDVAAGKLLATSLRAFYALLAVFPVLALPLLMGGVTGSQFWKTMLALTNAMVFSLALAMLVSACVRDAQQAIKLSLVVLMTVIGLLPMLDYSLQKNTAAFTPTFSALSPFAAFFDALTGGGTPYYWSALGASHLTAWFFLATASRLTPRLWQEKRSVDPGSRAYAWRFGPGTFRQKLRLRWLDKNPVCWLAMRERWQGLFFYIAALVFLLVAAINTSSGMTIVFVAAAFLGLLLEVWIATQAARIFIDAKRSGALEILLCSPLDPVQVVKGYLHGLLRTIAPAVLLVAALQAMVPNSIQVGGTENAMLEQIVAAASTALTLGMSCLALAWFGMWTGLTIQKPAAAALKTIALVELIPWIFLTIAQVALIFGLSALFSELEISHSNLNVAQRISISALSVAKDIAFIWWARRRLYGCFREAASGQPCVLSRPAPAAETQVPTVG